MHDPFDLIGISLLYPPALNPSLAFSGVSSRGNDSMGRPVEIQPPCRRSADISRVAHGVVHRCVESQKHCTEYTDCT
jgi:hypothetical protein